MADKRIKGITIEIGADSTGLDKALKDVEKGANKAKSELRDVDRLLKDAPDSAVLWAQKQELLTKAVEESRKKLDLLKNSQEDVEKQFKSGKIGEDQYRAFQRELEKAKNETENFERKLKELKESADDASDKVDDLSDSTKDAGENAEESGDGFTILKGIIADLAADGIKAAIDGFKELADEGDRALNGLQAQTGATAEQMKKYQEVMDNLYANNYGEDRIDIADSIAAVKQQLGELDSSELENVTEKAFILRDTFGFEINESIRTADMLMNQFEVSADEAFALIAQGAQNGLDKNGDLLDTINEYSVHYKTLGYNAEEFFNSLSNGTEAGTFSVDKLGDAMKEFNIRQKEGADETVAIWQKLGVVEADYGEEISEVNDLITDKTAKVEKLKRQLEYARIEQQGFTDATSELTKLKASDNIASMELELAELEKGLANNKVTLEALTNTTSDAKYTADELMDAFNSGGEKARTATEDIIQALFALDDETLRNQAGVALFGTMWEDLQASGIQALTTVTGEADKTATTLEDIAEVKYNDLGSQLESLGKKAKTELIEPIAEKALPKLKSGTEWLIENLPEIEEIVEDMLPLIKGIGTGFISWKALSGLGSGISKVKELTTVLKTTSSLAGLTSTGIVGIAAALAVGVGSYVHSVKEAEEARLQKIFDDATEASRNLSEKVKESAESMALMKEEAEDQVEADKVLIDRTQRLYTELQTLVNENGLVKEGYEDRVSYITNELEEATGIEIECIDGQIQKYGELKDSIQEVINKKRAESMENAYSGVYQESVKSRDTAWKTYSEAESIISQNEYEIDRIRRKAEQAAQEAYKSTADLPELTSANYDYWAMFINEDDKERLSAAETNIITARQTMNEQQQLFQQSQSDMEMYEAAQKAMLEGNYNNAEYYFSKIGDLDRTALRDAEGNLDEQLKAIKNMTQDALDEYRIKNDMGYTDAKDTFAAAIADIAQQATEGGISAGDLLSSGIVSQLSSIDGFDATMLLEFAKTLGVDFGEVLGYVSADKASSIMTQYLYSVNDLIPQNINSQSDYELYKQGKYAVGIPMMADGGFLHNGAAVVAEAGPELLEIINGGARVTPLTGSAKNTAVNGMGPRNVTVNQYIHVNELKNSYDTRRMAQDLSAETRRVESGKGKR